MRQNHIPKETLEQFIELQPVFFLNYRGEEIDQHELWEQYQEGWRVAIVTEPITNAIVKIWVVATSNHRDHFGLDTSEVIDSVIVFENEESEDFFSRWIESGGEMFEVEFE